MYSQLIVRHHGAQILPQSHAQEGEQTMHARLRLIILALAGTLFAAGAKADCNRPSTDYERQDCAFKADRDFRRGNTEVDQARDSYLQNLRRNAEAEAEAAEQQRREADYQRMREETQERNRQQARRTARINEVMAMSELGHGHYAAARYREAASAYRKALALSGEYFNDPQNQATMIYSLGLALLGARQYGEAETLFRQVLAIPNRRHEAESNAAVTNNLGLAMLGNKRYGEVEALFKNQAPLNEQSLDLNNPRSGPALDAWSGAMDNWATALEKLGRYAEAEPLRKRVQGALYHAMPLSDQRYIRASVALHDNQEELKRRAAGQRSVDEYKAINRMNEFIYLKKYDQALLACDDAMRMAERHQTPDLLTLAQENKADVLLKLSRPAEAKALLIQALAKAEKSATAQDQAARLRTSLASLKEDAEGARAKAPTPAK
jgi:hypothetical protein